MKNYNYNFCTAESYGIRIEIAMCVVIFSDVCTRYMSIKDYDIYL